MHPAAALAMTLIVLGPAHPAFGEDHALTVPFTEKLNFQAYDPEYNPRHHYTPFIRLRLLNPENGADLDVSGVLDTGADSCVVGDDVVERLGLTLVVMPPVQVRTGGGPITVPYVKLSYRLRDDQGTMVDTFPQQTAHCLVVKEPKVPIILGFIGFIDRFKSVTLRYPAEIVLVW
jgi:hypothetical protein